MKELIELLNSTHFVYGCFIGAGFGVALVSFCVWQDEKITAKQHAAEIERQKLIADHWFGEATSSTKTAKALQVLNNRPVNFWDTKRN